MNKHRQFIVSHAEGRPLYLQIVEQARQKVALGDWAPGEAIPSIRELAASLCVSVVTVKRAYLELEHEGVIATRQGRASTVSQRPGLRTVVCEKELQQHLAQAAGLARLLGLAPDDLAARLRAAAQGNENEHQ